MILGIYENVANPSQIQSAPFSVVAGNLAMGGVKMQRLTRYWGSDVFPAGQTIRGFRFRLTWSGLSQSEMETLYDAHQAAVTGYVRLKTKDLGVTFDNTLTDEYYVTVDSQSPALATNWQPGYANDGTGPVVYDAEAYFVGTTVWDE